jgi:hypothetical protein
MAKFHNKVGYSRSVETAPGVFTDQIEEREYFGDVIRETKNFRTGDQVNDNVSVSNRISIVGDDFAFSNYSGIRYVIWGEVYWKVSSIEVQRPRLILSIGGVYNGNKA